MSDAYPYAGHVDVVPAARLANTIGTVKLVLVVLVAVVSVLVAATSYAGLFPLIWGLVVALSIYITFGWLEQTLRLLIGIAYNSAESAGLGPSVPLSDDGVTY